MMNVDGGKVMKMNKIMLIICAYAVLLSSFFRIPYLSTTWFKIVVLLYGFIVSKYYPYWWEKKIQMYKTDIIVEGIQVYRLPYNLMKSHNAMIFKGKKNNIIVEDELMEHLSQEQLKAVLYHEVGHTHTVGGETIYGINLFALYFASQGMYQCIHENSGMLYTLIGLGLLLLAGILKRYIEYKADEYVVQCGYDREMLISAIEYMEQMNGKHKIIISDHPSTKKRYRKLK